NILQIYPATKDEFAPPADGHFLQAVPGEFSQRARAIAFWKNQTARGRPFSGENSAAAGGFFAGFHEKSAGSSGNPEPRNGGERQKAHFQNLQAAFRKSACDTGWA